MATVIEEFDSTKITNASIQFIRGGVKVPGMKFGCIGTIEGETEMLEYVKNCEGRESKKITKPQRMTLTISGHITVEVARSIFGLKSEGLKPGVYSYGDTSTGERFVLTADVIDEFEDQVKLIAFANCSSNTGLQINIENGGDELAELEMEFTVLVDDNGKFYYEAFEAEVEDPEVIAEWHTDFTPELVTAVA